MTTEEAVAAAAAASGLPEWAWALGAAIGGAIVTTIIRLGNKAGASDKTDATVVAGMARFAPESEKRSTDTIMTTLGEFDMKLEGLDTRTEEMDGKLDRLLIIAEKEERERQEEEKEELRELRRLAKRLDPR